MVAVLRFRSVCPTGATFDRPVDFRVEDYMKGSVRASALYEVTSRR